MNKTVRNGFVVGFGFAMLWLSTTAKAQDPSLAEQAAAARSHHGRALNPEILGHCVRGDYHNELLGLEILRISGWTSMSRGMMNVDEAIGRDALGMQAGLEQGQNRVFGMHDEAGSSVIVAIVPIPDGESVDPARLKAELVGLTQKQLPNAQVSGEAVLLGDSSHHFTGVRVSYSVATREIFQSLQLIAVGRYALSMTVSAPTANQLHQVLEQLQACLRWGAQPAAQ